MKYNMVWQLNKPGEAVENKDVYIQDRDYPIVNNDDDDLLIIENSKNIKHLNNLKKITVTYVNSVNELVEDIKKIMSKGEC